MLQLIAATLGVQPHQGLSLAGSIRQFLEAKCLLLVLDNCEHLLDAAGRIADDILHSCPRVRILATSREGLGIEGEHNRVVRSLALPEISSGLEDAMTSDAVRLFADRAHAAAADFSLDAVQAQAVVEVCRRLDGVPLAIELAAARVAVMSPQEIGDRLDERFRLLTGGRRTAVERHQTLRATVDWSHSLLAETDQEVFARLGSFTGTFSGAAAEAVVSGQGIDEWEVLEALASLVSKSMVVIDHVSAEGITRYAMLETLRAYARERPTRAAKLTSGGADAPTTTPSSQSRPGRASPVPTS
jgi:predicted ATPase